MLAVLNERETGNGQLFIYSTHGCKLTIPTIDSFKSFSAGTRSRWFRALPFWVMSGKAKLNKAKRLSDSTVKGQKPSKISSVFVLLAIQACCAVRIEIAIGELIIVEAAQYEVC